MRLMKKYCLCQNKHLLPNWILNGISHVTDYPVYMQNNIYYLAILIKNTLQYFIVHIIFFCMFINTCLNPSTFNELMFCSLKRTNKIIINMFFTSDAGDKSASMEQVEIKGASRGCYIEIVV